MSASLLEVDNIKISVLRFGTLQEQSSGEFWGNGDRFAADVGAETPSTALKQVMFLLGISSFKGREMEQRILSWCFLESKRRPKLLSFGKYTFINVHKFLIMERRCFPITTAQRDVIKRNMEWGRIFHVWATGVDCPHCCQCSVHQGYSVSCDWSRGVR